MIYICIPTYNEERTVGVLLWKIRQVMADFPRDYQILVTDDASTDATPEILQPYTRILPLTVHRNERRIGYAASLELMLREAARRSNYPKRDIAVTLQADFTEEPDEIPTLVKRIEGGADVVTGAIRLARDDAPRTVRWARTAFGLLLRRAHWPAEVTDPLSGFRAYRIIILRKVFQARDGRPLLEWDGWFANAGLLRAVLPYARRVDEAPVPVRYHRRRRATRFRPLETGREFVRFLRANGAGHATADEAGGGPATGAGGEERDERPRRPRRRQPAAAAATSEAGAERPRTRRGGRRGGRRRTRGRPRGNGSAERAEQGSAGSTGEG
ncbi:MAG TPA: glycosyltransferase family 2 protein [Longimicrobiales bacterium]